LALNAMTGVWILTANNSTVKAGDDLQLIANTLLGTKILDDTRLIK
jgi:hypothetical protein